MYTEAELKDLGYHLEDYAHGFMIAFYAGNDARFTGQSLYWSRQPMVSDPFHSRDAAVAAISDYLKGGGIEPCK